MDYSDDYDVYNLHKVHSIRTKENILYYYYEKLH